MIDHIDWHTEEDYPSELPKENALNHMGFFWAWAVNRDLAHPQIATEMAHHLLAIKNRQMTGKTCVQDYLGQQLQLNFFNPLGERFAAFYYEDEEEGYGDFIHDYVNTLGINDAPSLYHTEDSWENYDKLAPVFNHAFDAWYQTLSIKD